MPFSWMPTFSKPNSNIKSRFKSEYIFVFFYLTISSMLISIVLVQLFVSILFLLYLFEKNEEKRNAFDGYTAVVFMFGIVRIVAIAFSNYPSSSMQALYKEAFFYMGILAFGFYMKIFFKKLETIIGIFIISSAIIALLGIILFDLNLVNRAQSISSGYTVFSIFLLQSFILTIFTFRQLNFKNSNLLGGLSLTLILTALITSMGRTNIAIVFIVILCALLMKKIDLKLTFVILLITGTLSFVSFKINHNEISRHIENPTSLSDRDVIWEGAAKLAFIHPIIGYGPRTFNDIFPFPERFADKGIGAWHNQYLDIYFESGIIGLFSFIYLVFYLLKGCVNFLKTKPNNELNKGIIQGLLYIILAYCLTSLTTGFVTSIVLSIQFAFFIGILSAIKHFNPPKAI
jgi:O-antigen ligase